MLALFNRILCAARGHGGVRFERVDRVTVLPSNSVRGTRYTCKACGAKWTEWDK